MNFKFLFSFLVCVISAFVVEAAEPNKPLELQCIRPTVLIREVFGEQSASGTGTIVRSEEVKKGLYCNIVLTCKHVTSNFYRPTIIVANYSDWSKLDGEKSETYQAIVTHSNPDHDIAVMMFLSNKKLPTAKVCVDENLYIGNEILGLGCAWNIHARLDVGRITGIDGPMIRMQLNVIPGDSGGGVFYDYKLIAIKCVHFLHSGNFGNDPVYEVSGSLNLNVLPEWALTDKSIVPTYDDSTMLYQLPVTFCKARMFEKPNENEFVHP